MVHPMVENRFVVEVGDTQALKTCITHIGDIESVFDAYQGMPTGCAAPHLIWRSAGCGRAGLRVCGGRRCGWVGGACVGDARSD